jgi:midasin
MKSDLEMFDLPIPLTKDDLLKTLKSIYNLQQNGTAHQPVKFEWVAGDLIRAIECGEWIVLDNANFCNPTVCSLTFTYFAFCPAVCFLLILVSYFILLGA